MVVEMKITLHIDFQRGVTDKWQSVSMQNCGIFIIVSVGLHAT